MKKLTAFMLTAIMLFSLAACGERGMKGTPPVYTDENGETIEVDPATDFTVYDKKGKRVKLSDMLGKPVVLNFWASWCPPCQSEMPDFDKICKELEGEVVFMMVNLPDGWQETQQTGQAFIDSMGYTFPVYFDNDHEAAYLYEIEAIPTTYFIDAWGRVVAFIEEAMDAETLRRGIAMIYPEISEE